MSSVVSQSFLDRVIVPFYIESEFSTGYDNNYLKLSSNEKDDDDVFYVLGDSQKFDSGIIRNKTNFLYMPYIFRNHDTRFDFRVTTSKYLSSDLKSYSNYYMRLSQHLGPYTWFKCVYSYTPSFYLKSYAQSDPYILTSFEDRSYNYMPSTFSSEKVSFELTSPIPYLRKTYWTVRYLSESQYYNSDFTEFDLKINNYYFKVKKKINKYFNISIAHMISEADNISYLNGLVSTSNKDRGFVQGKTYASFSINNFFLFNKKTSLGTLYSLESRSFSSDIESDVLHFSRMHEDSNITYWIKSRINNNIALKLKGSFRNRLTSSSSDYVENLKTFDKHEFWFSIIFNWDVNVY